jgi:OOP family OmpA-OmpF porin
MHLDRSLIAAVALAALLAAPAHAVVRPEAQAELQKDQTGAHDFAPAGRYDGAHLLAQTVKQFDELTLPAGPTTADAANPSPHFATVATARGRITRSLYIAPPGRSTLEIVTNHEDALKHAGFDVAFECGGDKCGENFAKLKYSTDNKDQRIVVDGATQLRGYLTDAMLEYVKDVRYALLKKSGGDGDTFVAIYAAQMTGGSHGDSSDAVAGSEGVLIEAVEPKAMEQKIVTVSATEIDTKLATEGRAIFYGLYFDFDKADIKPESEPQLAEMAKYLTSHPSNNVYVVGHTDNQGKLDYNVALSQKRAEAVAAALAVRYHIDPHRMLARGLGPLAPIAENRDDAGRAKNRRVEIVDQATP